MYINHSSSNPLLSSQVQSTNNKTQVNHQREQTRANEQEQSAQKDQSLSQQQRLDVDQQALSRIERYTSERNDQFSQTRSVNGGYDQPSEKNQLAVNSYRSIEAISQRESIKQTFGVDLFA
ncbi:hypothetical protein [Thalassotalea profundi]|uniref:Uncharacterized protein n=1 Tax=Thalassotalea profundi TaxID=2036687 RepID=A0ABQ3IEZ7_9GAMM|nr:hypothetical protein [Thalassotalea profundi]GHE78530.1 hypothetical protein GCM10011501_02950 [Thalassotalea profundi]